MQKKNAKNRIDELRKLISKYSYEYHVNDAPSVSDAIYDGLFNELKQLEAENPDLITPESPTQRVGNELKGGFEKVAHASRMLSLNDVFSAEDVLKWFKRVEKMTSEKLDFFADIKMDGLACSLIYVDGKLNRAVTRGDSFIGEDVTNNVRTIRNVPLELQSSKNYPEISFGRTEIRGEILILKDDFEKINHQMIEKGQSEYKNPRNLAAGTVRQLDPKLVASRPLVFIAYDIIREDDREIRTWEQAYQILGEIGIRRNSEARRCEDLNEVVKFIDFWDKARLDLPFNTDGLVVKINNRKIYKDLGVVGKQPRAAIAYKYAAEQATTIVKDIVISIGRTGAATPVAVFEPVQVAGTTVKHASLHNADEIERLDVRRGDTVVIYKAGDIIPKVESVIMDLRPKESKKIDFEDELKRQYPELEFYRPQGEAVYRVRGAVQSVILAKSIEHYASRGAVDINTLGEKNVKALVDAGLVQDLADIYSLKFEDVVSLERFAKISAQKLIDAINNAKNPDLDKFIYGLGVRHIGAQTAKDLADKFQSLNSLRQADLDDFLEVDGIGVVVAESLAGWLFDDQNQDLLDKFTSLGVVPHYESKSDGYLSGISIAVTGTLSAMSRLEFSDLIQKNGGKFNTSVTKDTNYLVYGGKIGASKKAKAEKLGVQILSEKEFSDQVFDLTK